MSRHVMSHPAGANLAFLVAGESVLTFIPSITGMAHEATGCK